MPLLGRIGPLARTFDFVANAAPGVKEILTVGKLCYEVRERNYDLVVVDASATGHVVGQLAAPQAINELVKVGLVRDQTDWMLDILADPATTGRGDRATPEEMPVNETHRAGRPARATETDVDLAAVVVNRVLPELFGRGEEEVFDALREPDARRRARRGRRRPASRPVLDAARAGRHPAPHPRRAPRPACATELARRPAAALRAVPVHPGPRRAGDPRRWPRPWRAELGD